jgi:hypothetical protein
MVSAAQLDAALVDRRAVCGQRDDFSARGMNAEVALIRRSFGARFVVFAVAATAMA